MGLIGVLKSLNFDNLSEADKTALKKKLQDHKKQLTDAANMVDRHIKKLSKTKKKKTKRNMNQQDIKDAIALVRNRRMTRRTAIERALTGGAVVAAGMLLPELALPKAARAQTTAVTDTDIFNFALNFEYLEAEYYTLATAGHSIKEEGIGLPGDARA